MRAITAPSPIACGRLDSLPGRSGVVGASVRAWEMIRVSAMELWARPHHVAVGVLLLFGAALTLAASSSRADNVRLAPPAGAIRRDDRAEPANWGPAMLTFVVDVEVWGTTGLGERPRCLVNLGWRPGRPGRADGIESIEWSPDGKRLVYTAKMSLDDPPSIWERTYSAGGDARGEPTCLCAIGGRPHWSPDGSMLACTVADAPGDLEYPDPRLIVIRFDENHVRRDAIDLTPILQTFFGRGKGAQRWRVCAVDFTWSPSGRMLATTARWRIVVVDLDTHTAQEVGPPGGVSQPKWSPTADWLAFSGSSGSEPPYQYDIYIMHSDGTGLTSITNDAREDDHPTWSPDGRLIAFLERRPQEERRDAPAILPHAPGVPPIEGLPSAPEYTYAIWVMNADGTNQRQLTEEVATGDEPLWSPDGRWIAYKTSKFCSSGDHLWVVPIDGSPPQEVAADLHGIGAIAWRPAVTTSPTDSD